eukprot:CAMPEP_0177265718 /NCGR_PEP_ID=MMETSP0367-20130122/62275_1 /TAXON_ID=447022 ORGANISM="Scrippsiella hangoei-like, Strain SHHI-4" /NCGR_SAMPLE_ID=MMETSP0367 /ASSEMBLY_ACC=CAM_ASM_000362 /LENGTH=50 /DNA_ID=CAMNT_0018720989 /DNA_START=69 /DNA_END=217 /DNA_ORIENTATION=-
MSAPLMGVLLGARLPKSEPTGVLFGARLPKSEPARLTLRSGQGKGRGVPT